MSSKRLLASSALIFSFLLISTIPSFGVSTVMLSSATTTEPEPNDRLDKIEQRLSNLEGNQTFIFSEISSIDDVIDVIKDDIVDILDWIRNLLKITEDTVEEEII